MCAYKTLSFLQAEHKAENENTCEYKEGDFAVLKNCHKTVQRGSSSHSKPLYFPAIPPHKRWAMCWGVLQLCCFYGQDWTGKCQTPPQCAALHSSHPSSHTTSAAETSSHAVSCPCYHSLERFLVNFCFHTNCDTARESQNKQHDLLEEAQHHLPPLMSTFCIPGERECSEGRHRLWCAGFEPTNPSVSAI